ncbi:hypothetical protein, partial [Thermaurantimonas aggregans]|uniref:hypothetical protein n=1 Tax=Thermaurantimonas aggregans TaxID=2173829 RepID=UPI0023F31628
AKPARTGEEVVPSSASKLMKKFRLIHINETLLPDFGKVLMTDRITGGVHFRRVFGIGRFIDCLKMSLTKVVV